MTSILIETTCPACHSAHVASELPTTPDIQPYCCTDCGAHWTESTELIEAVECY